MLQIEPAVAPVVDIGANLTHESFKTDFNAVVDRATAANITHLVVTGSDLASSRAAFEISTAQPERFSATAGIHPHYANQFDEAAATCIAELAKESCVRAIGETGLDFFRDICARDVQEQSFIRHIEIAARTGLPMFLHQRQAHDRFTSILKEHRGRIGDVVVHCFTDTAEALEDYLALDCHIGITGWICDERRGQHLLASVRNIPAERLMIETDAPYLIPRTLKPKPKTRRNEPCTLPCVLRTVAAARGETEQRVAETTTANARRFFSIE